MERVSVGDLEPDSAARGERRSLADPLGATDVAVNHYSLDPGERLAGLHAHERQEEVFVVLEGRLTFETLEGEVAVGSGEAISFAPREHKSGKADGSASVLAIGAPPADGDVFIPLPCRQCGHGELRLEFDDREALICPACGEARRPNCPECGGDDLLAVWDGQRGTVVSECRDCRAQFD